MKHSTKLWGRANPCEPAHARLAGSGPVKMFHSKGGRAGFEPALTMDSAPAVESVFSDKIPTKGLPEARLSRLAAPPQRTFQGKPLVGFEPTVFVAENNNVFQQAVGKFIFNDRRGIESEHLRRLIQLADCVTFINAGGTRTHISGLQGMDSNSAVGQMSFKKPNEVGCRDLPLLSVAFASDSGHAPDHLREMP